MIKKAITSLRLNLFQQSKSLVTTSGVVQKCVKKQDGRFVPLVTKDLQTLNLKFSQVTFHSLVFTWERNFHVLKKF